MKVLELTSEGRIPAHLRLKYINEAIKNGMKLLTYDLETSHSWVRTFYIGSKVSIRETQVICPTKIITIQYALNRGKALFLDWDRKVVSKSLEGPFNFTDKSMVEEFISNVYNQSDLILTQNGDAFDDKILAERSKMNKTTPLLRHIPTIDILKLSRQSVRPLSHKLDYRSQQQALGGKKRMLDQDWVDVEENKVSVLKKMVPYGLKDVRDTRAVFWKELPYYKTLPKKVESVILKFLTKADYVLPATLKQIICPTCRKKRHKATDVQHVRGNTYLCNTCNKKFGITGL